MKVQLNGVIVCKIVNTLLLKIKGNTKPNLLNLIETVIKIVMEIRKSKRTNQAKANFVKIDLLWYQQLLPSSTASVFAANGVIQVGSIYLLASVLKTNGNHVLQLIEEKHLLGVCRNQILVIRTLINIPVQSPV